MIRDEVDNFREDFEKAMEPLRVKYNASIFMKSVKYTSTSLNFPVEVLFGNEGTSGEEVEFGRLSLQFGFTPEDYGKTFISNGRHFKFVGFNTRARKYPFIGEELGTGKRYKFNKVRIL